MFPAFHVLRVFHSRQSNGHQAHTIAVTIRRELGGCRSLLTPYGGAGSGHTHATRELWVSRTRVAVGLSGVAVGGAWAGGGTDALVSALHVAEVAVPAALTALGLWHMLRLAVPAGKLAAPFTLVVMGLGALAIALNLVTAPRVPHAGAVLLIMGGFVMALHRGRPRPQGLLDTAVRRYTSILVRHVDTTLTGRAPAKLILRSVLFGSLRVDLTNTEFPSAERLTVDVSVLFGNVELAVPESWTVKAGRVELTSGVRFDGDLSSADLAPLLPVEGEWDDKTVVLNVQGSGGAVSVTRS